RSGGSPGTSCSPAAGRARSRILRKAGDGRDQDCTEHPAGDADAGKEEALSTGQTRTFGIVEELRELPVDLDGRQEPGETGAETPHAAALARGRHPAPEIRAAGDGNAEHPVENDERVSPDAETSHVLQEVRENPASRIGFHLPLPDAAEIADFVG